MVCQCCCLTSTLRPAAEGISGHVCWDASHMLQCSRLPTFPKCHTAPSRHLECFAASMAFAVAATAAAREVLPSWLSHLVTCMAFCVALSLRHLQLPFHSQLMRDVCSVTVKRYAVLAQFGLLVLVTAMHWQRTLSVHRLATTSLLPGLWYSYW